MLVDKQSELMSDLLFTVRQHGGDDVTWKPPIENIRIFKILLDEMAIAKITVLLILSCKRQLLPGIFYIFHALCGVIVCILFILSRFILFRSFLTAEVSIKNFCNNFLACIFFRYKRKPWLQWKPCNNRKICSKGKINFIELFPVIQCFNICYVLFIFRMTLVLLQFQMMLSWKQRNMLLFMTVTQVQWRTKVSHALTLFTKFILETIIIIFNTIKKFKVTQITNSL